MSDYDTDDRLNPEMRSNSTESSEFDEVLGQVPFFSPVFPSELVHASGPDGLPDVPEEAFISPDEPIDRDEFLEGTVAGIGEGKGSGPLDLPVVPAEEVERVADNLEMIVGALRSRGPNVLRAWGEPRDLETALQFFIKGYLLGRSE